MNLRALFSNPTPVHNSPRIQASRLSEQLNSEISSAHPYPRPPHKNYSPKPLHERVEDVLKFAKAIEKIALDTGVPSLQQLKTNSSLSANVAQLKLEAFLHFTQSALEDSLWSTYFSLHQESIAENLKAGVTPSGSPTFQLLTKELLPSLNNISSIKAHVKQIFLALSTLLRI